MGLDHRKEHPLKYTVSKAAPKSSVLLYIPHDRSFTRVVHPRVC